MSRTVTGTWITVEEATDPRYWGRHLRQTVRFADGLDELLKQPGALLLEVGPGTALSTFARRHPRSDRGACDPELAATAAGSISRTSNAFWLRLGKLWLAGAAIDWRANYRHEQRRRLALPTYPFERQRHWAEARRAPASASWCSTSRCSICRWRQTPSAPPEGYHAPRTPVEQALCAVWQPLLGVRQVGIHDNFFDLGGDSLLAIELIANIQKALQVELSSHSLLQAPTVAMLAAQIDQRELAGDNGQAQQAASSEESLLVPIQPNGRKRPLFLIHPVGGGVYLYRDLAQQLGRERPIYGIQAQGPGRPGRADRPDRGHGPAVCQAGAQRAARRPLPAGRLLVRRRRQLRDGPAATGAGPAGRAAGADRSRRTSQRAPRS